LELVHCFSLIHDDLPALDNDDLRRGRPTCHKAFGEAIAILAGDALFALAFQVIAAPRIGLVPPLSHRMDCLRILTRSVGMSGLVAGEAADILAEGHDVDPDLLTFIHTHKTGALIEASCEMGAVIAASSREAIAQLGAYGRKVGLAFQVADDILNETASAEELGKSAGSDRERKKATFPALFGLDKSREEAGRLVEEAVGHLERLPGATEFLRDLARFSVERKA
jgi:geranylgeranyl diphosphate synthase type II